MELAIWGITLGVATFGAVSDIRSGRVYNWLTYPAALVGILLNIYAKGTEGLLLGLEGWLAGLGLLLIPYLLGVVGGGDVKMLAAVGAFLGPLNAVMVLLWGSILGGAVAIALLVKRREFTVTMITLVLSPRLALTTLAQGKQDFPFALNIALGVIVVIATGYWLGYRAIGYWW